MLRSFKVDEGKEEVYHKLKELAAREKRDLSDIIMELIEVYVKNHAEGNPNFSITQWVNNEDFKAVPATMATNLSWGNYLRNCNLKELYEIRKKLRDLDNISDNIMRDKEHR